ncbi:hypothetical protein A2W54_01295 [Candidatus Giovannonibacteria bacterium RIFCSPHIGHO2_02_43_13]|uniref:VWFA domain-containing protein n=1 Tax=Candidatus Giovannonibacteria bacterium RIFCSPHIGHO2_02_43_13 TaxID=1798330 RepID=A0A1F5WUM6_9BACT|nr:MAG: hypothetical protein UW28_C0001G0017 [Parcubacteria group bacterium GW2011_GWA2_44_13]OGF72965.1 MAG: hypothetical protein A3E06_03220 [Candidatus Giovannonibacteria bacterium RIFCSPHIGHO2_12_FULL_44_42]OGF79350.1 MAG: hypothetical protein A2W54_01295 [Candidatus Giovannonibacteria bacterium RIFCSPHIGHO2_02_43_13]OGF90397.1 MAG: hypothetical protein A3I94_00530 [Candidatus Giovannonibacteria bacterium RIFCSPLOWO2_02_FULL_43_54]OGF97209.1 MAG: hypothetical protein A3H08_03570 [Candidatus
MEIMNSYFEAPIFLIMIPAFFFLIFIGRAKRKITASSGALFLLAEVSRTGRALRGIVFVLPKFLIFTGICVIIIAVAEPRNRETKIVSRVESGRIAVIIDDVSGSMMGKNIAILKSANMAFLDAFCNKEGGDNDGLSQNLVGVVAFSADADIRMTPTGDCAIIRRRIAALEIDSSTAIEKGLWKGLALIIEWADRGRLIPNDEFRRVKASLYERQLRIPKKSAEFCRTHKGLSLLLFTDGDFDYRFQSREAALQMTRDRTNFTAMNPFNVIDLAKSLCIRTYFWSMGDLPQSYKDAFSNPPGSGLAVQISGLDKTELIKSYEDAAKREAGEIISEEIVEWNPLKRYFISTGTICFLLGLLIFWSKNYSHREGKI